MGHEERGGTGMIARRKFYRVVFIVAGIGNYFLSYSGSANFSVPYFLSGASDMK
jgi:hypothetical protein